jgi:hypothetical protein
MCESACDPVLAGACMYEYVHVGEREKCVCWEWPTGDRHTDVANAIERTASHTKMKKEQ